MEDRREWVPIPGTDKVRLIVDGEVVSLDRSCPRRRRPRMPPVPVKKPSQPVDTRSSSK